MLAGDHRFHGHASLNGVYRRGRAVHGPLLTLRYCENPRRRKYRVAVVVARKVAKSAVTRNRIRRRIYEVVRVHAAIKAGGYDLVFTVFSDELTVIEASKLKSMVLAQLRKAQLLAPTDTKH